MTPHWHAGQGCPELGHRESGLGRHLGLCAQVFRHTPVCRCPFSARLSEIS